MRLGRFTEKRLAVLVATVIFALFAAFCSDRPVPGRVSGVDDGDSFTVDTQDGARVRVRLYGVDAPEGRQAWGAEAGNFTRGLLSAREVELRVIETDQYDRKVALVKLEDGRILNEELVRNGHAWVYRRYCQESLCADWMALELDARDKKKGLWSGNNPIAPWIWRKRNG